MDTISLSGIELYAFGGVSAEEKAIGQRYRVDVTMELDLGRAAESDSIGDTVHYGHVHDLVVQTMREREFNLIESAAGRVASRLLATFPVEAVTVQVRKLLPPIDGVVEWAGVTVTRRRETPSESGGE